MRLDDRMGLGPVSRGSDLGDLVEWIWVQKRACGSVPVNDTVELIVIKTDQYFSMKHLLVVTPTSRSGVCVCVCLCTLYIYIYIYTERRERESERE